MIEELSDDYLRLAESMRTTAEHAEPVAESPRESLALSQLDMGASHQRPFLQDTNGSALTTKK